MRVLVVDDSIVVRKMIRLAFDDNPLVSETVTAPSAYAAREKLAAYVFDLIICDINMPQETGVDFVKKLKDSGDKTPVVFFSSLDDESINNSLSALNVGALDIVAKPQGLSQSEVSDYINIKISPFLFIKKNAERAKKVERVPKGGHDLNLIGVKCLAIGGSTGSPSAIEEMMTKLKPLNIPVLVSIHMPPGFAAGMAQRLNRLTSLNVKVANIGDKLEANHCYIADGGSSMIVEKSGVDFVIGRNKTPGPGEIFPSVNELFLSVASSFKQKLLSIVLTGMGTDGLIGAKCVKTNGGKIIIQDEASCAVYGMPCAIARESLEHAQLNLEEMAKVINENFKIGECKNHAS